MILCVLLSASKSYCELLKADRTGINFYSLLARNQGIVQLLAVKAESLGTDQQSSELPKPVRVEDRATQFQA